MNDFTATISNRSNPDRAIAWRTVFGSETIVLKSPIPSLAKLPGRLTTTLIYEVDIRALTGPQRKRLVAHLAEKFGYEAQVVEDALDTEGCPILAEDVIVTIKNPQRWLD
jgi:hypothetical protein